MKSRGADTRGVKAKAQKAASANEKDRRERQREEAKESAQWAKGSNTKQAKRDAQNKDKAAALLNKKQLKKDYPVLP